MKTTTDRLFVAYNPNSTRASLADQGVRQALDGLNLPKGQIAEYAFKFANTDDNIADIAEQIQDGDVVFGIGGDGSYHTAGNAVRLSEKKDVRLGVLGYGNFNDGANTFNHEVDVRNPLPLLSRNAATTVVYPLEVLVNDEKWREGMLYVSLGGAAVLASLFDDPRVRESLHAGKTSAAQNYARIAKKYFELSKDKDRFLDPFRHAHDDTLQTTVTDVMNVNGPRAARFIRSHNHHYQTDSFTQNDLDISHIAPNLPFIMSSLMHHMPGRLMTEDTIRFEQPATVPIQADGEYTLLTDVNTIQIRKKVNDGLTVITNRNQQGDTSA